MWYRPVAGQNTLLSDQITFLRKDSRAVDAPADWGTVSVWSSVSELSPSGYFPIDDLGFGNYCWRDSVSPNKQLRNECLWQQQTHLSGTAASCNQRNFHFTSYFHMDFIYDANDIAKVQLSACSDFWLYVNGERFIDMGGVDMHTQLTRDAQMVELSEKHFPTLQNGRIARMSLFTAQRSTAACTSDKLVMDIQPICPMERQGEQCGVSSDSCHAYQCLDNMCQRVVVGAEGDACLLSPATDDECVKYVCNSTGVCVAREMSACEPALIGMCRKFFVICF